MRRAWLLLGLGLIAVALFAAPASASKEPDPEEAKKRVEDIDEIVKSDLKPETKIAQIEELLREEEESNIFKGFLDLSVWTIVVFLVLLIVLAKFAWKPMLAGLKEREDSIHHAMEEAKAAKEEATKLRAELQAEIVKARAEGQAIRDETRRDAERLREEIMGKAKAEMQAERERLRTDMETARDQVLAELWAQTAQLSTMIAAKAVRRQITIEDQNRLVDEALAELRGAASNRRSL